MSTNDIHQNDAELYMGDSTTIDDALEFVEARLRNPAVMGEVVVFNFHNASLEAQALLDWARGAEPGIYVIPYQIPGVWAFMTRVLPPEIGNARLMAYRQSSDRYVDYDNWRAVGTREIAPGMRRLDAALDEVAEQLPSEVVDE